MKRCPKCQAEYPDDANWCRFDGGRLEVVPAAKPPAPQPGALTMGWDVPNVPTTFTGTPPPRPGEPQAAPPPKGPPQPSALTMGWDVQPEPSAADTTPSMLAPNPTLPAPSTPAAT